MGKRLLGFGLAVSLALGSAFWLLSLPTPPPVWPPILQGEQAHWVWGRVASLTRSGPHSVRFAFEIQGLHRSGANGANVRLQHTVKVWVTWPRWGDAVVQVAPGEVWLLPLRWRAAAIEPGPGGFNAPLWLKQQGLQGFAQVVTPAQIVGQARLLKAGPLDVQHLRQSVRDRILKTISDHRRAALVVALSMGDQNAIDQEDWEV